MKPTDREEKHKGKSVVISMNVELYYDDSCMVCCNSLDGVRLLRQQEDARDVWVRTRCMDIHTERDYDA